MGYKNQVSQTFVSPVEADYEQWGSCIHGKHTKGQELVNFRVYRRITNLIQKFKIQENRSVSLVLY